MKKKFKDRKIGKLFNSIIVPVIRGVAKGTSMPLVNAGIEVFRNIKAAKEGNGQPHSTVSIVVQVAVPLLLAIAMIAGWVDKDTFSFLLDALKG